MRKYLHGIIRQMAEKYAKARLETMLEKAMHMTYAELPHTYDAWKHLATGGYFGHDFYADDPEIFPGLKNGRRNTEVQASLYDAMLAEIYAERNKAKARRVRKPDTRTREQRLADWDAEKERRKDRRIDAKCNHINKKYGYLCIEQERRISAEKVARADWELEQNSIAEDRYYAELEEEYREWERRYRHEKYMRNLNEWLKYA